jgi:hypothetical protein
MAVGYQPYILASLNGQDDSWYSLLLDAGVNPKAVMKLEGLDQLKNQMTSLGIELATFQLVEEFLKQLCYYNFL